MLYIQGFHQPRLLYFHIPPAVKQGHSDSSISSETLDTTWLYIYIFTVLLNSVFYFEARKLWIFLIIVDNLLPFVSLLINALVNSEANLFACTWVGITVQLLVKQCNNRIWRVLLKRLHNDACSLSIYEYGGGKASFLDDLRNLETLSSWILFRWTVRVDNQHAPFLSDINLPHHVALK